MIHFLVALRGFGRAIVSVWRDPETKALPFVVGILLLSGTIFYWSVEDWTLIQALYFSVVTLTTVGYGDLTPTFSRIFIRQKVEVADRAREHLSALTHHDQPPDEGRSQ